jgi:cytochrome c-type biogenesis protein CcmH/NrfG
MRLWVPFLFLLATLAFAQAPAADTEAKALSDALAEAGNSQIDFVRALENHLAKYPDSAK